MLKTFVSYLKNNLNLSEHSIKAYQNDLVDFMNWCNENDLSANAIKYKDILSYISHLESKGYAVSTQNRRIMSLKKFYKFMVDMEEVKSSPVVKVHAKSNVKKGDAYLKREQVKELLSVVESQKKSYSYYRDIAIIKTFLSLGLRNEELRSIKVKDVDFDNREIKVMRKGRVEQVLPITSELADAIKDYMEDRYHDSEYLFVSRNGGKFTSRAINDLVTKYVSKVVSDKNYHKPHVLRHTCASLIVNSGVPVPTAQWLLNHSNIETTQRYLHTSKEEVRAHMDSVSVW